MDEDELDNLLKGLKQAAFGLPNCSPASSSVGTSRTSSKRLHVSKAVGYRSPLSPRSARISAPPFQKTNAPIAIDDEDGLVQTKDTANNGGKHSERAAMADDVRSKNTAMQGGKSLTIRTMRK